MTSSQADPEVARFEALPVSVLADVLDRVGRRSQAVAPGVRPLQGRLASVSGSAFPIAEAASDGRAENGSELERVVPRPARTG